MHTWLLVTKSNCTDFLVLVVILMCHALILIDQHIQQQGRYFNNQLLFLVFFLLIIYIMCKIFAHTILPLYQSYIIMGLGFFFKLKNRGYFYFILFLLWCIISDWHFSSSLCVVVGTNVLFVLWQLSSSTFFGDCYHFDPGMFYFNINVI